MAIMAAPQRQPERAQEDDLSKALKVMQLFGTGYGIKDAIDKNNATKETQKLQQEQAGFARNEESRKADDFKYQQSERERKTNQQWNEMELAEIAAKKRSGQSDPLTVAIRQQQLIDSQNRAKADAEKAAHDKTPEGRMAKLSAEQKGRLDNAKMAMNAVQGMGGALASGDNTFSLIGDNDFTQQRALFEEALGRMQSGGAIGVEEAKAFKALAPTYWDTPEMREKKLVQLQSEMESRIGTLGFKTDELGVQKKQISLVPKQNVPNAANQIKPTQQDAEAIRWAMENPTDPRSASILKANGVEKQVSR